MKFWPENIDSWSKLRFDTPTSCQTDMNMVTDGFTPGDENDCQCFIGVGIGIGVEKVPGQASIPTPMENVPGE